MLGGSVKSLEDKSLKMVFARPPNKKLLLIAILNLLIPSEQPLENSFIHVSSHRNCSNSIESTPTNTTAVNTTEVNEAIICSSVFGELFLSVGIASTCKTRAKISSETKIGA